MYIWSSGLERPGSGSLLDSHSVSARATSKEGFCGATMGAWRTVFSATLGPHGEEEQCINKMLQKRQQLWHTLQRLQIKIRACVCFHTKDFCQGFCLSSSQIRYRWRLCCVCGLYIFILPWIVLHQPVASCFKGTCKETHFPYIYLSSVQNIQLQGGEWKPMP